MKNDIRQAVAAIWNSSLQNITPFARPVLEVKHIMAFASFVLLALCPPSLASNAAGVVEVDPATLAPKKEKKAPAPVVNIDPSIYNGEWRLISLNGKKVSPYWIARISKGNLYLITSSPKTKCTTTTSMSFTGKNATLTTTKTNCKGEKVGDEDHGYFGLFGNTLTWVSKTNKLKMVFVRNKVLAEAEKDDEPKQVLTTPKAAPPAEDKKPPKLRANHPMVVKHPVEPDVEKIEIVSPSGSITEGDVPVYWNKGANVRKYYFAMLGKERGGEFFDGALELSHSVCAGNSCVYEKEMNPGYYTIRIDTEYIRTSTVVSFTVTDPAAPPAKSKKNAKRIRGKIVPPQDIIAPYGELGADQPMEFSWNFDEGAQAFEVRIRKDGAPKDQDIVIAGDTNAICRANTCSVTLDNPLEPGEYTWWYVVEIYSFGEENRLSVKVDPSIDRRRYRR